MRIRQTATLAAVYAGVLLLTACHVDVRKEEETGKADVEVRTPVGDVSVHTGVETADTGLAVYPDARPLRERNDPENANVNVGNSWFGVKVIAAKYESSAEPQAILDFYRNEMKRYGTVTECRGNVDFKGRREPVCKEKPSDRDIQLVVGSEEKHRIVSVKPRGDGSEFALVYIQTRGAT